MWKLILYAQLKALLPYARVAHLMMTIAAIFKKGKMGTDCSFKEQIKQGDPCNVGTASSLISRIMNIKEVTLPHLKPIINMKCI